MNQLLSGPGLFGTHASLISDLTLLAVIALGLLFTRGVFLARRGNPVGHHFSQIVATFLITVLVLWLMVLPFRDFVLRDQGGPRPPYFYILTIIHAGVGASAILLGIFVVLASNNLIPNVLPYKRYKPVMRVSYTLFMLAVLTGVIVYFTWYVLVPNVPR